MGSLAIPQENVEEIAARIQSHAQRNADGCLIWVGCTTRDGYGGMSLDGRKVGAHRLAYAVFNGPIPSGVQVCHSCDVRACIEPTHLWLGTNSDNQRDAVDKGRHGQSIKEYCSSGHPFDDENTYLRQARGRRHRQCRACNREAQRRRLAKKAVLT
jgi:hypothetical protein